jgi:hypothetical protein
MHSDLFAGLAQQYVVLIDKHEGHDLRSFVAQLHPLLVELYRAALLLPAVEPTEDDQPNRIGMEEWTKIFQSLGAKFGARNQYSEMFDPYDSADEEPVKPALSDDLADIYHDLKQGLDRWNSGKKEDAIWHWRFLFESHWGRHASDALRPLHALVFDYGVESPRSEGAV